ncbi:hypothetical protein HAX54_025413, partial [Datura stramonium]|nr:hypothetical protein [Datura stramonium]
PTLAPIATAAPWLVVTRVPLDWWPFQGMGESIGSGTRPSCLSHALARTCAQHSWTLGG